VFIIPSERLCNAPYGVLWVYPIKVGAVVSVLRKQYRDDDTNTLLLGSDATAHLKNRIISITVHNCIFRFAYISLYLPLVSGKDIYIYSKKKKGATPPKGRRLRY